MTNKSPINLLNPGRFKKQTPLAKHHKAYSTGELPVFIISACLTKHGVSDNDEATDELRGELEFMELSHKEVRGCYEGVEERSFVVNCSIQDALKLGADYSQDSVLHLDTSRRATLHYCGSHDFGNTEAIGRLVTCTEEEARAGDNWTFDILQNTYFRVV